MALINLTLQGKGGVGKSFVASLLAQHYLKRDTPLHCYDTDPVNQTFAGYKAFPVETIRLGERPDEINPRYFDALIEQIMTGPEDGVVVIDNGASTFLPLLGYMVEAQALQMLADAGHEVRLHTVLTGGQALNDTMQGLHQVLQSVPDIPVVVWLNEYFGRIERKNASGEVESFEHSGLCKKNKNRIHALVRLPEVRKETFGHDIEQMMRARLTFDEAGKHADFPLMSRQRLMMTWRSIGASMEQAVL
ncbi:conjugal transfer protein TraL [Thalassospira tepidiphila]|uniref:conjugal transfer protein TraL n=1 Tax=Thalassospira tepidiphila TaxID=393657 RepID=UPI001BCB4968|nr:conjugal transfer protein TraL [Thalassospira tepidiphila]MBS8275622.1 conjugal transfer protein TraL [Thalassospira tepidiphila]